MCATLLYRLNHTRHRRFTRGWNLYVTCSRLELLSGSSTLRTTVLTFHQTCACYWKSLYLECLYRKSPSLFSASASLPCNQVASKHILNICFLLTIYDGCSRAILLVLFRCSWMWSRYEKPGSPVIPIIPWLGVFFTKVLQQAFWDLLMVLKIWKFWLWVASILPGSICRGAVSFLAGHSTHTLMTSDLSLKLPV